jgi:tetratricopeptide (TPR) repeat protein
MKKIVVVGAAIGAAFLLHCKIANAQGRTGGGNPAQDAFNDAMKAFNADDTDTALAKFNEAINLDAGMVDAYWHAAAIYYAKKDYQKGVQVTRRCPDQKNSDVRQYLGLNLYKTAPQPPPEAITLLEGVAKEKPDAYVVQLQLGQFYMKTAPQDVKRAEQAVDAFEQYFKSRPAPAADNKPAVAVDDEVRGKLGLAYLYAHNWDAAQRHFEADLRAKPGDLNAKMFLGTALVGKEDCNKAITLYEGILAQAQKQPSIYYNLGKCYLKSGADGKAVLQGEAYTRAKPTDAKGFVLVGDGYYEQRNWQKALTAFLTAERLDQQSGLIKAKLGKTYLAQKNYPAALTVLEQASKAQPSDVDVQCGLAEVYAATNASKDKLNALAVKLGLNSKDAKAMAASGLAYYAAGNDDGASQAYRAALGIDPANGAAKLALVKVLNHRAAGSFEKDALRAQQYLEEAARLVPDDLMTNRNLGLVLIAAKKYSDAEAALQRPLKKVPNDMVVNRLLGRALLGQSKQAAALAAYEKAAQIALRTRGLDLAGVYAELGPIYLESGKLDQAVTVLEQALKEAGPSPSPLGQTAQRNLAIAYYMRGTSRMRDPKDAEGALDDILKAVQAPKGTFTSKELTAITCGEAFAALKAGKISEAEEAFQRAITGGGCQVRPPYDKLGVALFSAYAGYRDNNNPSKREAAAKQLASLQSKSTGAAAEWVKQLLRSCYEFLAYDYFQRSDEKRAESFLKSARKVPTKGDALVLEHNQGALDLALGRSAQAEKELDALNGRPAESLVNLGILKDRQGETKKALELYKRALDRGARAPKLKEWIDVKERLFEVRS